MNLKSTAAGRGSFDLSLVIYCSLGTLEPNSAYTRMQECKSARKGFTKLVICLLTPLRATAIHSRPVRKGNKKSQIELIER